MEGSIMYLCCSDCCSDYYLALAKKKQLCWICGITWCLFLLVCLSTSCCYPHADFRGACMRQHLWTIFEAWRHYMQSLGQPPAAILFFDSVQETLKTPRLNGYKNDGSGSLNACGDLDAEQLRSAKWGKSLIYISIYWSPNLSLPSVISLYNCS